MPLSFRKANGTDAIVVTTNAKSIGISLFLNRCVILAYAKREKSREKV